MSKNIITMTKGDTFDFTVTIFEELYGHYYTETRPGDIIEFAVLRPNQEYTHHFNDSDEEDLLPIRKQIIIEDENPNDECTFYLEHSDTKNLPVGVYYYTVKLIRRPYPTENFEMQVLTIINRTKFVLNN